MKISADYWHRLSDGTEPGLPGVRAHDLTGAVTVVSTIAARTHPPRHRVGGAQHRGMFHPYTGDFPTRTAALLLRAASERLDIIAMKSTCSMQWDVAPSDRPGSAGRARPTPPLIIGGHHSGCPPACSAVQPRFDGRPRKLPHVYASSDILHLFLLNHFHSVARTIRAIPVKKVTSTKLMDPKPSAGGGEHRGLYRANP